MPRIEVDSNHKPELILDSDDLVDNCDYVDWDHIDALTKETNNKLKILQLNIWGIKGKYHDLIDLINKLVEPDIVILCETWLKPSDAQPQISDYNYIRQHRVSRKGGGVGFLVNKKLRARSLSELKLDEDVGESLFIEIKGDHQNMVVGSLYCPPNTPVKNPVNSYQALCAKLGKYKHVIIGLDHNLDLLKFTRHSQTQQFLEVTLESNLIPTVTKPTCITNSSATLTDNIFIKTDLHESHGSKYIHNISDHYPSLLTMENPSLSIIEHKQIKHRKIKECELAEIKNKMSKISWGTELELHGTNDAFAVFHDKMTNILNHVAPEKIITIRNRRNVPWFTLGIKRSNDKDKRLFKACWSVTAMTEQKERYLGYHKVLQKAKRIAQQFYYRNLCKEFRHNSQKLWKIINSLSGKNNNKNSMIDHLKINNIELHKESEIAKTFAEHLSGVGRCFTSKIPKSNKNCSDYLSSTPSSNSNLFLAPTNPIEIMQIISKLPNKKSVGYDTINNILLKDLSDVIAEPLSIIFNKSMTEGRFPDKMKSADTVPLYKSKESYIVDNYQPISLLITVSKILKKLMHKRVYDHLDKNGLIYNSQYGFCPRHSCENAVSELLSVIMKGHENNKSTVAVFLDLSKAFDTLSHTVLLNKLERYGI